MSMKPEQVLPSIMIILSVGAAIVYACHHNWRLTIYWTAAAVLTTSVTF